MTRPTRIARRSACERAAHPSSATDVADVRTTGPHAVATATWTASRSGVDVKNTRRWGVFNRGRREIVNQDGHAIGQPQPALVPVRSADVERRVRTSSPW